MLNLRARGGMERLQANAKLLKKWIFGKSFAFCPHCKKKLPKEPTTRQEIYCSECWKKIREESDIDMENKLDAGD